MNLYSYLQLAALFGMVFATVSVVVTTLRTGVPPMPTSRTVRDRMLALIPQDAADPIVDLGCGWGSLVFTVAKRHQDREIVGYEVSLIPWLFCCFRRRWGSFENVRIVRRDFWSVALQDAGVVLCYLDPSRMGALTDKLSAELRPGSIVISNSFALRSWEPEQCSRVNGL